MKKFLSLLCVVLAAFLLTSCGGEKIIDRSYDEKEVSDAARSLIAASATLNEIFYGTGIPASDAEDAIEYGSYKEADAAYLAEVGFESLSQLEEMTRAVFSEGQSDWMIDGKLDRVLDEDGNIIGYARYYEREEKKIDAQTGATVQRTVIFVNTSPTFVMVDGEVYYDLDSLRVDRSRGEHVIVSLSVRVTDEAGEDHTVRRSYRLLEESDGWRLDSPTYIKYNADTDRYYEQLQ